MARIPKSVVESSPETAEATSRRNSLVRAARAAFSDRPYEVRTNDVFSALAPFGEAEQAETSIEKIDARWQQRLTEEVDRARREGLLEGRAAERAEMQAAHEEALHALAHDLGAVRQSGERFLRAAESRLVRLALKIATTILDAPLPEEVRRVSETAIAEAVDRMAGEVPVDVVVHPVTLLRMREAGLEEQLGNVHGKLRWRTNADMLPNEWVVRCARSAVRRLEAELLDRIAQELSGRDLNREGDDQETD